MSETDGFIDEVNEAVQRDQMMGYVRRYGWIVALVVIAIVGGTAYNEYRKSSIEGAAQAKGAAIAEALEAEDAVERAEALAPLAETGDVVASFFAAGQYEQAGDNAAAVALLTTLSEGADVPQVYRELALVKRLAIDADISADERALLLDRLAQPGGAYRTIALELQALAEVDAGQTDAALTQLQAVLNDAEATNVQRQRVAQLMVALGGTPELANLGFDATTLQGQ